MDLEKLSRYTPRTIGRRRHLDNLALADAFARAGFPNHDPSQDAYLVYVMPEQTKEMRELIAQREPDGQAAFLRKLGKDPASTGAGQEFMRALNSTDSKPHLVDMDLWERSILQVMPAIANADKDATKARLQVYYQPEHKRGHLARQVRADEFKKQGEDVFALLATLKVSPDKP